MSTPPTLIHFGRGGAGNTTSTTPSSRRRPSHAADSFPSRAPRRFSTGIGGHANIVPNDSPSEDMQALLDNNAPGMVLSTSPRTLYGITGAGNVYKASSSDIESAKANNDGLRKASLATLGSRRSSKTAASGSDISAGEMSASPPSRRGSLVASVREFLDRKGNSS